MAVSTALCVRSIEPQQHKKIVAVEEATGDVPLLVATSKARVGGLVQAGYSFR